MAKGAYIGIQTFEKRALPSGYTQVEYIRSSGTQYFNTGFKPNNNTRVVVDFENIGDYSGMTTSLCPFFGARNGSSSAVFALWIGKKTFPQYGNVAYNKNGNFTVNLNTRLLYDFNKNVAKIGDSTITCATATFTTNYEMCLLTINNYGTIESRRASGKLYSCQIYDNGTLVRDFVPCKNSSGTIGLYDLANSKFYTNAGTGTFTAGVDKESVARKIKKGFVGIEGKARKIKKAYIGDANGKARKFFGGELVYRGRGVVSLSTYRSNLTGAANKNYAFFFGGTSAWNNSSASTSSVDAISKDLVRYTAPALSYAQYGVSCGSIGEYAVTAEYYGDNLYRYNGDLTKTLIRNIYSNDTVTIRGSGVNTKDYLVFPARYNGNDEQVLILDKDLTIRRVPTTGFKVTNHNVSFLGNVIFQGRGYWNDDPTTTLYRMDNDLTITQLSAKLRGSETTDRAAARATVGKYCIFAGGQVKRYDDEGDVIPENTSMVDILNDDFTISKGVDLIRTYSGNTPLAASPDGFAIIAFGYRNDAIRAYDDSLTIVMQTNSDYGRAYTIPVVIGDHILFAGGYITYRNQASDDEAMNIELFSIK